jgi:hypothetical protein
VAEAEEAEGRDGAAGHITDREVPDVPMAQQAAGVEAVGVPGNCPTRETTEATATG